VIAFDTGILNRYKAPASDLVAEQGCFTNWLGLRTEASMFASCEQITGRIFADVPLSDDGVYGGVAEYASFLTAIEQSRDQGRFNAIELGAGWGPWISGVGKVCQRLGFSEINLLGVEADRDKCRLMKEHMARNRINAKVTHGAAWKEDTTLRFPVIHSQDHGAAATAKTDIKDYRGFEQRYVEVPAFSLATMCADMPIIDYMHWDIQGAELELARSGADLLNKRVRFLFVGTHSRPIEGGLIEFFYEHQWDVLY
jgi:FkbM family methyltransferase